MSSPYWQLPRAAQGRVLPDFATVPHGVNVFCLGLDSPTRYGRTNMLLPGESISIYQDVSGDPSHKMIRFCWLVRNPRQMPQARVAVNAGSVSFKATELLGGTDAVRGLYVDPAPFLAADRDQLVTVSGATDGANNGTFRVSSVPQGQSPVYDDGTMAVIENDSLVGHLNDPAVTVKVLGARWVARAYITDELRAEVAEPAGHEWQRSELALHLSKLTGTFQIKFTLALESVTP